MTRRDVEVRTNFSKPPQYVISVRDQDEDDESEIHLSEEEVDELTDQLIYLKLTRNASTEIINNERQSWELTANFIFPFSEVVRTNEQRLQKNFCLWLIANGWFIRARFVGRGMDIHARYDDDDQGMITALIVECKADKGRYTGEHIDNAYGQLLRRISRNPIRDALAINVDVYYALVIQKTDACIKAARRVSGHLRQLLRITVYAVDDDGRVHEVTDDDLIPR